ncbi:MAG TPA: hypothetical protein VMX17_12730 [Candidatus Glassbacteria bacterium]|nr:hypothetical protein [Candidatus Glassbacteria bacterium]
MYEIIKQKFRESTIDRMLKDENIIGKVIQITHDDTRYEVDVRPTVVHFWEEVKQADPPGVVIRTESGIWFSVFLVARDTETELYKSLVSGAELTQNQKLNIMLRNRKFMPIVSAFLLKVKQDK